MLVAQISDTHITEPDQMTYGFVPVAENLARCVANINNLSRQPDLVLLSGDVTSDCSLNEAKHAASILDDLACPYFLVPGNHDDRSALWRVFGGTACPSMSGEFINYVIEGHDLRIIALDSVAVGEPGGEICAARADWLNACLNAGGDQPTIIFMHHPPLKCGVPETDEDGFKGADILGKVIDRYPNIERILCGHIHLLTHARWHGTVVSTSPSMGMQLDLDLTQAKPSEFLLSDPAYLLHYWTPESQLITHMVQVNDLSGPYPFAHAELSV